MNNKLNKMNQDFELINPDCPLTCGINNNNYSNNQNYGR